MDLGGLVSEDGGGAAVGCIVGKLIVGADKDRAGYTEAPQVAVFRVAGVEAKALADEATADVAGVAVG